MSTAKAVIYILLPLSLGIVLSKYTHHSVDSWDSLTATVLTAPLTKEVSKVNVAPQDNNSTMAVFPKPKEITAFTLEDHHGMEFTKEGLQGHWSFLFFGYTRCPDICPTTLALLDRVDGILRKETPSAIPKMIFISVDPKRDTHNALADYVTYFNPNFLGVSGNLPQLRHLTRQLGLVFGLEDGGNMENYEVYHSARIILIDPQARFSALLSPPHIAKTIVENYKEMINNFNS